MVEILSLFLIMFLFIYVLKIMKDKTNLVSPGFIFLIIWCAIFILYSLSLYNMNTVPNSTLTILFLGVVSTVIGILLGEKYRIKRSRKIDKGISKKAYFVCSALLAVILVATAYNSISLLLSGVSLGSIRYTERGSVLNSGLIDILYNYYAVPMGYLLIHVNINSLFKEGKSKKIYIISTVFIAVTSILTEAGRFIIYFIAIDALVLYFAHNKQLFKSNPKVKKYVRLIVIACVVGFIYITTNRGSDVYKTLYTYLCGCVPYFDNKINHFHSNYDHTYIFASLNGFIRPVTVILNKFIGLPVPSIVNVVEDILLDIEMNHQLIAPSVVYNGFVSMFYAFYVDLGIFGVIFYSLVFGCFAGSAYKNMVNMRTEKSMIFYLIMIQAVSISMMRFYFASFNFALTVVYLQVLYSKKSMDDY